MPVHLYIEKGSGSLSRAPTLLFNGPDANSGGETSLAFPVKMLSVLGIFSLKRLTARYWSPSSFYFYNFAVNYITFSRLFQTVFIKLPPIFYFLR
jgi:hypothetical protein